jgi:hypothetical protein
VKDENKMEAGQTKAEIDARDDAGKKVDMADAKKGNLKVRFMGCKDSLLGRIPQEHKGQGYRASGSRQDVPHQGVLPRGALRPVHPLRHEGMPFFSVFHVFF